MKRKSRAGSGGWMKYASIPRDKQNATKKHKQLKKLSTMTSSQTGHTPKNEIKCISLTPHKNKFKIKNRQTK